MVKLDWESRDALRALLQRDAERLALHRRRRIAYGDEAGVRADDALYPPGRVSPVVVEAILRWRDRPCPARRHQPFWTKPLEERPQPMPDPHDPGTLVPASHVRLLMCGDKVGVNLDEQCRAIVQRDADERYRGNKTEAIRAMICASRPPAFLPKFAPPRPWEELMAGMGRRYPRFSDTAPEDNPGWEWSRWNA